MVKIKSQRKDNFGHSVTEEVVEKDGIEFILITILVRAASPSIFALEQSLCEIKFVYNEKFG